MDVFLIQYVGRALQETPCKPLSLLFTLVNPIEKCSIDCYPHPNYDICLWLKLHICPFNWYCNDAELSDQTDLARPPMVVRAKPRPSLTSPRFKQVSLSNDSIICPPAIPYSEQHLYVWRLYRRVWSEFYWFGAQQGIRWLSCEGDSTREVSTRELQKTSFPGYITAGRSCFFLFGSFSETCKAFWKIHLYNILYMIRNTGTSRIFVRHVMLYMGTALQRHALESLALSLIFYTDFSWLPVILRNVLSKSV